MPYILLVFVTVIGGLLNAILTRPKGNIDKGYIKVLVFMIVIGAVSCTSTVFSNHVSANILKYGSDLSAFLSITSIFTYIAFWVGWGIMKLVNHIDNPSDEKPKSRYLTYFTLVVIIILIIFSIKGCVDESSNDYKKEHSEWTTKDPSQWDKDDKKDVENFYEYKNNQEK